MSKKTIMIAVTAIFLCTIVIIFIPSLLASNKENDAIDVLNELYDEDFVVAKSTAGKNLFKDTYMITVQSKNTKVTYDFEVNDGTYVGNYYSENINIEVNKLLEQRVDGLVMTNAHIEVNEPTPYKEAGIEQLDIKILTNASVPNEQLDALNALLKKDLGEVAIDLEVIIVENETSYEGVKKELELYFQLSTISVESLENLTYKTENYKY